MAALTTTADRSRRMLHIGFYAPALPSSERSNGIVTYVRVIRGALLALGHRVTVIAPSGIERPDGRIEAAPPERPTTMRLERLLARFPILGSRRQQGGHRIARLVRAAHRRDPFDLFEMEESFGWSAHLGLDVPVVTRLHGPHFLGKDEQETAGEAIASALRIDAEGCAVAHAQGITSPSAGLLEAALKHYRITPRYSEVIYNPTAAAPPERCWSIDRCDRNRLLFVGRFDLRKGADIALGAFALAALRNPQLRLVMCGPDPGVLLPSGIRLHFAEYLASMVPPELHSRIDYKGALPSAAIADLRRESALCLSTARFETFGYSMTEALAVGMPLIASDTYGIAELLRRGEHAFIVPVGDAGGIAATIEAALASPSQLAAIGAAGRDFCKAVLDPQQIAKKSVEFYRKLL